MNMYKQLSFFDDLEMPIAPGENNTKIYASPCGGCLCAKCSNNVDCLNVKSFEVNFTCFNCDDCYYYNGSGKRNRILKCNKFSITNYEAEKNRKYFKLIKSVERVN